MQFDPSQLVGNQAYKLLSGTILPRPIGWISTVDASGINNLAPFSFFNALTGDPPHVMFASGRPNGEPKDTLANALETGEFVANLVSEDTLEAMNLTATILPSEVDEFEFAGVTPVPSVMVNMPRVLESPVSFECKVVHTWSTSEHKNGGSTVVIGRVVWMHIADEILLPNYKIDVEKMQPVGRLAGGYYARTNDLIRLDRLPPQK